MTVYGIRQLTPFQLRIGNQVCDRARTLVDRLRKLEQVQKNSTYPAPDVDAVRGWLFDLARDDEQCSSRERRDVWQSLLEVAE